MNPMKVTVTKYFKNKEMHLQGRERESGLRGEREGCVNDTFIIKKLALLE